MAAVPREQFVPDERASTAYENQPVAIGDGQTASAPWIVAVMTAALDLSDVERVLEVGTGRGYGAAVLARCCSEVVTIERQPELAQAARTNLGDAGYDNVEVHTGDGALGAPQAAPFDAISVTAMAEGTPPAALSRQLTEDGVLVCPVGSHGHGELVQYRHGQSESLAAVGFVPLVTEHP